MSESGSEEVKTVPETGTFASEEIEPKTVKSRDGQEVVLIPQPSDDPEDPLVSRIYLPVIMRRRQQTLGPSPNLVLLLRVSLGC
jgi:hypothetical protein